MANEDIQIPTYIDLMRPTLEALAQLGGEGSNESVDAKVIEVGGITERHAIDVGENLYARRTSLPDGAARFGHGSGRIVHRQASDPAGEAVGMGFYG